MGLPPKPRVKRTAKRRNGRWLRLTVTEPGEVIIREGSERGRRVDVIEAPAGTKIYVPALTQPDEKS